MSEVIFEQRMIDLLEQAGEHAFEVMIEQYRINPEAMQALYGDPNDYH
jgi:hypothetical protein